jgi:hypothetical protein
VSRNPARKGRSDSNQPAIAQAIQAIGYRPMDLSAAGNGMEDLLVPVAVYVRRLPLEAWDAQGRLRIWLPAECKTLPVRYKPAQLAWRAQTAGWPRITVTSGADAIAQLREMTG